MKDFTNEHVGKEYNKFKNMLLIGVAFYVLAIVVICWAYFKGPDEGVSLHDLILNNPVSNKVGYLDTVSEPYAFAYYPGETSKFYFVMDNDYIYVAKMNSNDYNRLKSATEENPIRISGTTKEVPSDIKKLGIDAYNKGIDKDEQLSLSDFDSWFGAVYIDMTASAMGTQDIAVVVAAFIAIFGLSFTLAGGLAVRRFKKKVNKLSLEERQKIDKEMNDKDAFYYKNAHTYLTKNYIVNFMSTFEAILYKDVIWVYKYELRQNGVKTQQSVQVMTRDGKTHTIATLNGLTKKAKDVFDEILESIASRCTGALIGYNKENRTKVKELIVKPEKKKK